MREQASGKDLHFTSWNLCIKTANRVSIMLRYLDIYPKLPFKQTLQNGVVCNVFKNYASTLLNPQTEDADK